MKQETPLNELVDALSDRQIDSAQMAELNVRLETDAESRRGFLDLMRVEAELGAIHQPLAAWSFDDPHPTPGPLTGQSTPASLAARRAGDASRFLQLMGAVAASIALTAVGTFFLTREGAAGRGPFAALMIEDGAASETINEPVARVAATRNCRWRGAGGDLGFGADVAGGQMLELETGLAELTFAGGARLVLEGPAAFRISDAETVELYSGRVSAAIPAESDGFSVRTPRLVVEESGAQYGVIAGSTGGDEVHVFEGDVAAKAIDRNGRVTGVMNLVSFEAARFRTTSHRFARFNADDEGFVRSLETRDGPGEGLLAFDNFAYPTGPVAWQNGGFGWAGPWADLEAPELSDGDLTAAATNGVARGSITANDLVALGNRFVQTGNNNRVRRTLSTSLGGVFDAAGLVENADGLRLIGRSGSTIYLSFLQRVSKTDDIFYGVELHRGDGNYNRVLCVGSGDDGHGYGVTTKFQQEGHSRFESLGEEDVEVNHVVIRIEFGENDQDTATVYRNPVSLIDESACTPSATLHGKFAFDRVSLGNFKGSKVHEVDELRLGTDFGAVCGNLAPPPIDLTRIEPNRLSLYAAKLESGVALSSM